MDQPDTAGTVALRTLYVLTGLAVAAGVYFRFKGLGFSPFAIDEYYLATAVKSILEHGVPRFEGGGYYTRGLALQYMAAPLFLTGLSHEFAFRLIMVVFNLAALPAVFLLARHLAGNVAGCLALVLFSLSVWEVEFARFARMYTPFGTLFLWHIYFVYRRIVLDDSRALLWMYVISLCAIFVSEYAVFLALLNFLPVVLRSARRPLLEYLVPPCVLLLTYRWESIGFRRLGITDHLPPELVVEAVGSGRHLPIHPPPVMLVEALQSVPWMLGFVVPLVVFLVAAGAWVRWALQYQGSFRSRLAGLLPIAVLLLALLNLFSLAVWSAILILLCSGLRRSDLPGLIRSRLALLSALSVVASLTFWCIYLAATDWWAELLPTSAGVAWRDGVLLLFNYPNLFRETIVHWRAAMPVQSVLMGGLLLAGAWCAGNRCIAQQHGYLIVLAIFIGTMLMVPMFTKPYYTLRYYYIAYAPLLILSAAAIVYLAHAAARRSVVASALSVAILLGLMLLSEDYDSEHLLGIDSERATFRMGYPWGKIDQYYLRWDYRGPAEFVNARLAPEDIVISTEYSVPYYLRRMDYLYLDMKGGRFSIVSGQRGTRDIWEGARLLGSEVQLLDVIRAAPSTAWLIARSDRYGFQTAGERTASTLFDDQRVYRSVDGHLDVYRITSFDDVTTK